MRNHKGPQAQNVALSWPHPLACAWNQKAIRILAKKFSENVGKCDYQIMTALPPGISIDYLCDAIQQKLRRVQGELKKRAMISSQGTDLEQMRRLEDEAKIRNLRARRHMRRKNVSHFVFTLYLVTSLVG